MNAIAQAEPIVLYRPVGLREYELIRDSGFRSFPPRLPHQPIFYPVLEFDYAAKIARDWNTRDDASSFRGYVLRFRVRKEFLSRYGEHQAGDRMHREYWIPAEDIDRFNTNIVGLIACIAEFGQ
jgi:hypothetical protein